MINNTICFIGIALLLIKSTLSQTATPPLCGNDTSTQFCVCYQTSTECKIAIKEYGRSDCFYHINHGCISITELPTTTPTLNPSTKPTPNPTTNPITISPTTNPTLITSSPTTNPTQKSPTSNPTTIHPTNNPTIIPTKSPTQITPISTLNCGDTISGKTESAHDINWFGLELSVLSDLFIDSCGSSFDTWLYFQNIASTDSLIDCDDCGWCSLQAQLHISNVNQGTYMIGIGGYRGDFGGYKIGITCSTTTTTTTTSSTTTLDPNMNYSMEPTTFPTDIPTPFPTPKPTLAPTSNHTPNPTPKPTYSPSERLSKLTTEMPTKLPTQYPSYMPTMNVQLDNANEMDFFEHKNNKISGFELSLIFAVLLIIFIVGGIFIVRFITKRKQFHNTVFAVQNGYTDNEEDESHDSDDETMISYIHGTKNCVNIDEILERAKTDLINLATE